MSRYRLQSGEHGLELLDLFSKQKPLTAIFSDAAFLARLKRAGTRNELVARAVKAGPDTRVLDCTGGLGRDAFLLAWLGSNVTLVERSPVMHALLSDGLRAASQHKDLAVAAGRSNLLCADSLDLLTPEMPFDVIFIDPMFPERQQSAAVRGEMQLMQQFLGTDQDAASLLEHALATNVRRLVLKRPARSDWSPPVPVTHVFSNRTARYEVFVR